MAHEQVAHLTELGEHEGPLADVEQLVDQLVEAGQLARAPGDAAIRRRSAWAGWLQICLSRVSAASTRPRRCIPVVSAASASSWSTTCWYSTACSRVSPAHATCSILSGRSGTSARSALVRRSTNGCVNARSDAAASAASSLSSARSIGFA